MHATFFSIDQNSHSLWDTLPKLAALVRQGWSGTHFVEDVDVAFTQRGALLGDERLSLVRERVYRGGGLDWGAALFYTDFLGRLPLDVRRLEPYTGWTTAALSRRLNRSVDELYDRHSPSDNWQLVGASYVGDARHHRVIGDLRVAEIAPFLLEVVEHARRNVEESFPEESARRRTATWFERESALVRKLLAECADGFLVDLYRRWLRAHVPEGVGIAVTSDLLSLGRADAPHHELFAAFLSDYERLAALYNEAIADTDVGLSPLDQRQGELPFFVVLRREGRLVRASAALRAGRLTAGDLSWPLPGRAGRLPLAGMREAGVVCVAGKALLLVLHARFNPGGAVLVLPHMGSLYMPAAHAFERKLREAGLLQRETFPLHRVKFDFIDRWRGCRTIVRLPEYLHRAFGGAEMQAAEFAEEAPRRVAEAGRRLETMRTAAGRQRQRGELFGAELERRQALEARRRELARAPATRPQAGRIWDEVKELDRDLLSREVEWLVQELRVADLEYWNSRGALAPWSVALGGEALYERVLSEAQVYPESSGV